MGERAVVEEGTRTEPEPGSMAELYARYVPGGIRLAFLLTGDRNRADDLAHEAFVRCVGRFAHLRAHRAFEAYLRRAIVNLHTSGIRHRYVGAGLAPTRRSATGPRNRLPARRRGSRGSLEGAAGASGSTARGARPPLLRRPIRERHGRGARMQRRRGQVTRRSRFRNVAHDDRPGRRPMNDLDRDLRELFHDKAGSIDASPAAPTDVLRRGRRRQVRTVFASSLAAVAALAIAVAVAARLSGGPNQIPVTNPPYGERIATIHGITVTAPAGWTLIDDWPVASLLPTTSQTCSFSATGSPIGPSPAGGEHLERAGGAAFVFLHIGTHAAACRDPGAATRELRTPARRDGVSGRGPSVGRPAGGRRRGVRRGIPARHDDARLPRGMSRRGNRRQPSRTEGPPPRTRPSPSSDPTPLPATWRPSSDS